jgi:hypothetical protein
MLQVECSQLHASNEVAQKQEAKHKWQYQKQLRHLEFERDEVKQRELTCALHERRGHRFDERLRACENEVEGERVVVENARAVGTADLKRAREAYFSPFVQKTNIFKDPDFHPLQIFIRLHFQLIRTFCMRSTCRRSMCVWPTWSHGGKMRITRKGKRIKILSSKV